MNSIMKILKDTKMCRKLSREKTKELSELHDETIGNRGVRKSISLDLHNAQSRRLSCIINPRINILKKEVISKNTIKRHSNFY